MRRVFFILVIFILALPVWADEISAVSNPVQREIPSATPQNIAFENCTKIYSINKTKLFYLTLGAINTNKFTIDEIQTNNGYIIFTAARQKYLAAVAEVDKDNSILKITPCNNTYYFQPFILSNIFNNIESNKNKEL